MPEEPDPDLESRVTALESTVGDLTARVRRSEQDAAAARVLAGGADRDVEEMRGEMRDLRQAMASGFTAMRSDSTGLRTEFDDLRDQFDRGFAEVRGRLDATSAGQERIVELLTTLIDRDGDGHRAAPPPDQVAVARTVRGVHPRSTARAGVSVLLGFLLAGCAAPPVPTVPAPPSAPPTAPSTAGGQQGGVRAVPNSGSAAPLAPITGEGKQVQAAFEAFGAAQLRRDFTTACGMLTATARKQVIDGVGQTGSTGLTCEQAFAAVYQQPELAAALDGVNRAIRVLGVDVRGDSATVTYQGASGRTIAQLVREGGAWLVDKAG